MTPATREDAIYDLVLIATAWRIARIGSMDWSAAKERAEALMDDEYLPHDLPLSSIRHIANRLASEIVVGELAEALK